MSKLIKVGKERTILVFIGILMVSIFSIYAYSYGNNGIESARLTKQLIRFVLTVILLIMIYKGKNWAKVIAIILFSLAILGILIALYSNTIPSRFIDKVPYLTMIFVYLIAIYHFGFSKSFKAFVKHQNSDEME